MLGRRTRKHVHRRKPRQNLRQKIAHAQPKPLITPLFSHQTRTAKPYLLDLLTDSRRVPRRSRENLEFQQLLEAIFEIGSPEWISVVIWMLTFERSEERRVGK